MIKILENGNCKNVSMDYMTIDDCYLFMVDTISPNGCYLRSCIDVNCIYDIYA